MSGSVYTTTVHSRSPSVLSSFFFESAGRPVPVRGGIAAMLMDLCVVLIQILDFRAGELSMLLAGGRC